MTDSYTSAGKRLKEIREEKGLTYRELGEKVGVSHTYIYNIEKGNKRGNPEIFEKLAAALGVEIVDFFQDSKKPVTYELKKEGVEWIVLGEELEKQGITMDMVKEMVNRYKNSK